MMKYNFAVQDLGERFVVVDVEDSAGKDGCAESRFVNVDRAACCE